MKMIKKIPVVLLTFLMLFTLILTFAPFAMAAGSEVTITGSMDAIGIESAIQGAIDSASSGDIVTVIGNKMNENATINLAIPAGVTVIWKTLSEDLSLDIKGGGTFEVATGGKIEVTGKNAVKVDAGNVIVSGGEVILHTNHYVHEFLAPIHVEKGNVTVSDGKVLALRTDVNDWWHCSAIRVINGNVTVTGGTVSASRSSSTIYLDKGNVLVSGGIVSSIGETVNGNPTPNCYAVRIDYDGTVIITDGTVSADGASTYNDVITIGWGLAAYYAGTCIGDFYIEYLDYGIVVEVDSLAIPPEYHETTNGLTLMEGSTLSNAGWDTSGSTPLINFEYGGYSYSAPWRVASFPPVVYTEYPVRLFETGDLFRTLSEGITAANNLGLNNFTLEVIGDVTETSDIIISKENVTIVGAEGKHTVTLVSAQPFNARNFTVDGGGSLTLGDGTTTNDLTILHSVSVTNGTIHAKNGIILKSYVTLNLNGPNVNGTISGGYFEGVTTALNMSNGSQLQEISGGTFFGSQEAVHISGVDTKIHEISGGSFYQTDPDIKLHGQAIFVQNEAQIGEISGGYFQALRSSALIVVRGAHIEEISGGEFVAKNPLNTDGHPNSAIRVVTDFEYPGSSIGTISGGHLIGGHFGLLTIAEESTTNSSKIDKIVGGIFEAPVVGLQNDRRCVINEITGGQFKGSQGIFNVGKIGLIGGDADINGTGSYGIFNYLFYDMGEIGEISGGKIVGADYGIANWGNITLISGGTIIGGRYAINNDGLNPGRLDTITGGVFWGKTGTTINLAAGYPLQLEPGLTAAKGFGRYWGNGGVIFNNEALVNYPGTAPDIYFMSTKTEPVTDISGVQFKYLTLGSTIEVTFDSNGGSFVGGATTDTRAVVAGNSLGTDMPDAPTWAGYAFQEWNTASDGSGTEFTGSTVVNSDMTVYAQWEPTYEVIVNESYAAVTGAGNYTEGTLVTINAGSRSGYTFAGWTIDEGTVTLANANSSTTTFTMPSENVSVTARWNSSGGGGGGGTGGGNIVNPPGTVDPPETKPPDPEIPGIIIVVLLYMWAVATFIFNANREIEKERDENK